jgi:hypothetical protein
VGALAIRRVDLALRAREDRDLGPKGTRELDAHVPQAAHADHTDAVSGSDAVVPERRIGRDAGAKQRRGRCGFEHFGHAHDETLCHHDGLRVAAEGDAAVMAVPAVVGHDHGVAAIRLEAVIAGPTGATGVDHATDPDGIADGVGGHRGPDRGDAANDLVARHDREGGHGPVVVHEVDVGMPDPAIEDLDSDIVESRLAPLDAERRQGAAGGFGAVSG